MGRKIYAPVIFTIQNVPIKFKIWKWKNNWSWRFTIQNVPIKLISASRTRIAQLAFTIQNVPIKLKNDWKKYYHNE